LSIKVDNAAIPKLANIEFKENNVPLVQFFFDFKSTTLNISNIVIDKQTDSDFGFTVVSGVELQEGKTKTIFVDKVDSQQNGVCIKDAEIDSIDEISDNCNGASEYEVECDTTLQDGYTCSFDTSIGKYKITGLRYSGIKQIDFEQEESNGTLPPPPPPPDTNDTASDSDNSSVLSPPGTNDTDSDLDNSNVLPPSPPPPPGIDGSTQGTDGSSSDSATTQDSQATVDTLQTTPSTPQPGSSESSGKTAEKETTKVTETSTEQEKGSAIAMFSIVIGLGLLSVFSVLLVRYLKQPKIHTNVNPQVNRNIGRNINPNYLKLRNYIYQSELRGGKPDDIKQSLLRKNWPEQTINQAFRELKIKH